MRTQYKISLYIIGFFWIVFVTTAILYFNRDKSAIFDDSSEVVTVGKLSLNFSDTKAIMTTSLIPGESLEKKFTISSADEDTTYFSIALTNIINHFDETEDIIFEVHDLTTNTQLNSGKMLIEDGKIVTYLEIGAGETKKVSLIIKYKDGAENLNPKKDKKISASINVANEEKKITTFKEIILANNEIKNESRTQVGNDASTVEEGLILNTNENENVYYFRGVIENNYLKFGDYLWRIVRINSDGSIRVVTEELVNNVGSKYKSENIVEDADVTEYASFTNSEVYAALNSWYSSYLNDYDKYVMLGNFCFDDLVESEEDVITYASQTRLMVDKNPTFGCFGTKLENKIGLLTLDEVIFAGAASNYINTKFYLYNSSFQNSWWLMTPLKLSRTGTITMYDAKVNGSVFGGSLGNIARSLRPVINIDGNVEVSGDGTKDNPYSLI